MNNPIEINEYGQPIDIEESLKELFARVNATTPTPPEPKPDYLCQYRDCDQPWFTKVGDQQLCARHCNVVLRQISERDDLCIAACSGVETEDLIPEMITRLQARVAELEERLAECRDQKMIAQAALDRKGES